MRIGRKIGAGVAVAGLVLGTVQVAGAAPEPRGRPGFATVTLITGDRVVVHDETRVSVRPGEGREGMVFSTHTVGGHTFVLPSDAQRRVATGQVDRRLFDVTALVDFGYDDARRDSVPVIVTHPEGQAVPRAARVSRELPITTGVAVAADKSGAAWEAGLTGAGVTVAVLDTGVDQTHPDLADREIAEQNFSAAPDNVDRDGHGTHVASTVAGTGAKSGGRYRGIAPGASILDGKVLDDDGWGTDSGVIAGMEWAAQQGADIVNMSLGAWNTEEVDPVEQAVASLSARYGTLFVVAAGNFGASGTVGSPGSAPAALTVGAADRGNGLAPFSSRGPVVGDGGVKPDITAPGVDIVAAQHAADTFGNPVEDGYAAESGTSMAAPHVAGAAALVAQQHPDWTGQQLKSLLTGSAAPTEGPSAFDQGAGRVDVARAVDQTVVSEPASVNFGVVAWPHDDDVPVRETITYRNLGTTDVPLDLAVETSAPAGMFSLSANEVTVPAGGTAAVTVTGDARASTAIDAFSGVVVATAGDAVTRTPVGLVREDERYNLTLNYVDDQGRPTGHYLARVFEQEALGTVTYPYDEDGSVTVRLPKGRYLIDNLILTGGDEHRNVIVQPGVALDRDLTFTVDARDTRPVAITPPKPATLEHGKIGYTLNVENEWPIFGGVETGSDTTWQRVPVTAQQVAVLHHPANATSVSLRASATDRDGNTVKQTVIRAYTLR